ncbi:MAG TPA: ABC transporter permease [Thermomicrobiales bacterium]|nr:ABC transporter permease [Thermomicrobiales bacterium]
MDTTRADQLTPGLGSAALAGPRGKRQASLWVDAWRRLRRNRLAVIGIVFLVLLTFVALCAPLLAPEPFDQQNLTAITQPPGPGHLLGTDGLGRDVLSRLIYGARVSLAVGLVVEVMIVLIGVPVGLLAGYYGGWLDNVLMRLVDVLYAFPNLLFVIVIMTYLKAVLARPSAGLLGPVVLLNKASGGLLGVFIGLGLISWLTVSRLVRGQILSLKRKEYVEAARALGATDARIMRVHLLPNTLAPVIVAATLGIPGAILYEAGLSFLGLGVEPPTPSWGLMISEGIKFMQSYPYMLVGPVVALSLTMLSFNFLGDGLRDALDPWMKK